MKTFDEELGRIVNEALGEESFIFMSSELKGTEFAMPTEKLLRISDQALTAIKTLIKQHLPEPSKYPGHGKEVRADYIVTGYNSCLKAVEESLGL